MITEKEHLIAAKRRIEALIGQKKNELSRLEDALSVLQDAEEVIQGNLPTADEKFVDASTRSRVGNGEPLRMVSNYIKSNKDSFQGGVFTVQQLRSVVKLATSSVAQSLSKLVQQKKVNRLSKGTYQLLGSWDD